MSLNTDELYQISDELRGIAGAGLRYGENGYDRERYEQVLKIAARLTSRLEGASPDDLYAQFRGDLNHIGAILCVEAVVMRDDKILLIQRRDDRLWAVPGGVTEIGESLAQAVERELWEEAGIRGKVDTLLGLYDSRIWPAKTKVQLCMAQFLVRSEDLPTLHAPAGDGPSPFHETLDVNFFAEGALPPLSKGHELRISMAFRLLRGELVAPFFDR